MEKELKLRLISASLFLPFLLFSILSNQRIFFCILVVLIIFFCISEFSKLFKLSFLEKTLCIFFSSLILFSIFIYSYELPFFIYTFGVILCSLLQVLKKDVKEGLNKVGLCCLCICYLGIFPSFLMILKNVPFEGKWYLIYLFATTWVCDAVSYLVGKRCRKDRVFEPISPNKTKLGTIIGIISGTMVGLIIGTVSGIFGFLKAFLVSLVVSICGVFGDLFESLIKRCAGKKDSSRLIPGHGGVLDVFDSVIFNTVVLVLIIKFIK